MSRNIPPIVVLVPTHRRPHLAFKTVSSVAAAQDSSELGAVVIVENGPKTELESLLASRSWPFPLRYRHYDQAGKSITLNRALEEEVAPGSVVYFLDDDVAIGPRALTALREALAEHADAAFFGGPLDTEYEVTPPDWLKRYMPWSHAGFSLDATSASWVTRPVFIGSNWAAWRDVIVDAGGFSTALGPEKAAVGEETHLQETLLRSNRRGLYLPELRASHWVPAERCSPGWVLDRVYRQGLFEGHRSRPFPRCVTRVLKTLGAVAWLGARYLAARCTGDERRAFDARFKLARQRGITAGLWIGL